MQAWQDLWRMCGVGMFVWWVDRMGEGCVFLSLLHQRGLMHLFDFFFFASVLLFFFLFFSLHELLEIKIYNLDPPSW